MASIRNLKKEINYVLGDLIDAVTIWEITTNKGETEESRQIVEEIIGTYDAFLAKINNRGEAQKAGYFKSLRKDFHTEVIALVNKINALK